MIGRRLFIAAATFVMAAMLPLSVVAAALEPAAPESVGMSGERLAKIEALLAGEVAAGKLPGAVVLVARHGSLAYSRAVGVRDPAGGAPMTEDTIFRIYSMTKPLVSVAAMILVEDGVLQLTDPVARHLPAFETMVVSQSRADGFGRVEYRAQPAERAMTVHDLLRHTAGLAYGELTANAPVRQGLAQAGAFNPDGLAFDARHVSPDVQVAGLARTPLIHQPGTVWAYSLASDLLGRVVEAASGQRLGQFLQNRLFGPLGMTDTAFHAVDPARLAEPLPIDPDSGAPIALIQVGAPPANDSGGAGGVGTAGDYLRFCQMLLDGGVLDGRRILSRPTLAWMTADHLEPAIIMAITPGELLLGTPGYGFGLGFAVRKQAGLAAVPGSPGEFTWGGYAGTYFWVDPAEDLAVVFMSQAPGPRRQHYRRLIRQLVYQAIDD